MVKNVVRPHIVNNLILILVYYCLILFHKPIKNKPMKLFNRGIPHHCPSIKIDNIQILKAEKELIFKVPQGMTAKQFDDWRFLHIEYINDWIKSLNHA